MLGVIKKIFWGKGVGGGEFKTLQNFQIIVGLFDIRVRASLNSVTEDAVIKLQRIFSIKFKFVHEESEEKFCWL